MFVYVHVCICSVQVNGYVCVCVCFPLVAQRVFCVCSHSLSVSRLSVSSKQINESLVFSFFAPIHKKIDDLRKSRGLHSISAYRHGLYERSRPAGVAQSRHAFVGGTVSTWAR